MADPESAYPTLVARKIKRLVLDALLRPVPARQGVLIVTRADLFPADHGAAVKVERTAWGLSRLGGPVYLVTDDRKRYYRYLDGQRQDMPFPSWLASVGPWRRILHRRLRATGVPAQDVFLYVALKDWNLRLRAAFVAARHGIRIFQAEFPAYAHVCLWIRSLLGGISVLVEHNVEFERFRDQTKDLTPEGYDFLRRTEIDLCNRVDLVIAVSARDRDSLIRHGVEAGQVHVIPHGVDIPAFDNAEPTAGLLERHGIAPGHPVLVYHGTFLYPPNLESMQILATEILPRLGARGLYPMVLAVGPNPPRQSLHANIVFTGSVESVARYIKSADVAVVPLRHGGGTRMKLLDYFAAAVPVVSTSKGVEGLEVADGDQVLIRDDYDAFADAVARLLQNPQQARALGVAGRKYVQQFDWLNIARQYLTLFRSAAGARIDDKCIPISSRSGS